MNIPPLSDFLVQMAAPSFFAMLFVAALGATIRAGVFLTESAIRGRAFLELMARQLVGLAWPHLVLCLIAGGFWGWSLGKRMDWLTGRFLSGPMLLALIAILAALPATLLADMAWTKLNKAKPVRLALCLVASLAGLAALYLVMAGLKDITAALLGGGKHALPSSALYLPGGTALFWPALAGLVFLALTAGAGLDLVWMTIRRKRDDFGRDYYNFALSRMAFCGLLSAPAFLACQAWLFLALPGNLRELVLSGPLAGLWGTGLGCVLLACLCWVFVARSKSPLRLKGLVFTAMVLLWPANLLISTVLAALAPLA